MRCNKCNVDLPESYVCCPLCGSKAVPEEPLIKGIRTAEYPKVKTEPSGRNPFIVFIAIWFICSALSLALCLLNLISATAAAAVICGIACIWTLVARPLCIRQLYAGNFIVMNFFPFALASIVFSKLLYASILPALLGYLPICCIAILAALTVLILIKPKRSKRAASYSVLMAVLGVIMSISLFISGNIPILWLSVVVISLCILMLLTFINSKATIADELKAKFSIQ